MRIAALYDIHGNLPALEAVIREFRGRDVDAVVVGGDVVPGPMPAETLACLLDLDWPTHFLLGNGESDILAHLGGASIDHVREPFRELVQWSGDQFSAEQREALSSWPATVRLELPGRGEVVFCHATPRNNRDIFTKRTPDAPLLPIFNEANAPLVVCGHTHMPFDRMVGTIRVVNAGSVGMPFGHTGASWLLLDPDVRLQRTTYDLERAAERIRATAYPQATSFAAQNVLAPPSEEDILGMYARAELS